MRLGFDYIKFSKVYYKPIVENAFDFDLLNLKLPGIIVNLGLRNNKSSFCMNNVFDK